MLMPKTYRSMAKTGGGLGVWVVARSRSGHAHEYWAGGGIVRRRQRWAFELSHAFRFKAKTHALETLRRLRERDGRVDNVRHLQAEA